MHAFSYAPESLWSGPSAEASTVISITASILAIGYRAEEVICIRGGTHCAEPCRFGHLLFGDGMKRGLAAKLSWVLLRGQCANGALGADGSALKVLESLVRLPALELKL